MCKLKYISSHYKCFKRYNFQNKCEYKSCKYGCVWMFKNQFEYNNNAHLYPWIQTEKLKYKQFSKYESVLEIQTQFARNLSESPIEDYDNVTDPIYFHVIIKYCVASHNGMHCLHVFKLKVALLYDTQMFGGFSVSFNLVGWFKDCRRISHDISSIKHDLQYMHCDIAAFYSVLFLAEFFCLTENLWYLLLLYFGSFISIWWFL